MLFSLRDESIGRYRRRQRRRSRRGCPSRYFHLDRLGCMFSFRANFIESEPLLYENRRRAVDDGRRDRDRAYLGVYVGVEQR